MTCPTPVSYKTALSALETIFAKKIQMFEVVYP